jgi:hypothetical protein
MEVTKMRTMKGANRWLLLALTALAVLALAVPSAAYKRGAEVVSGGGAPSSSASYRAHDTIAQGPIGPRAEGASGTRGYDGFWLGLPSINVPVEGSFFGSVTESGTAMLRWTVAALHDVAALNIYRATSEDGPFDLLNSEPLELASPGTYEDSTVWPQTTFWYELRALMTDGTEQVVAGSPAMVTTDGRLVLTLYPARPNPFRDSATVRFDVPDHVGAVLITIYNVRGQVVRTLVDQPMERGRYERIWDGRDDSGSPAAAGVYFMSLIVDGKAERQKTMLLR